MDVPDRDRDRQHLRAQAEREGPVGLDPSRRAAGRGRAPGRRVQRGARRQGGRGPPPGAPGRAGRLLRRLHPDRPVHPRHRLRQRQARTGPGRRQEPHAGAAGRRPGRGGRRGRLRRLRLRRRALHGRLGPGRGRLHRRRAGGEDPRARREDQDRSGQRPVLRDGPADHRRPPRQGRLLRRERGRRGRRGGPRRHRLHRGGLRGRSLDRHLAAGQGAHDRQGLPGRDLRPGAVRAARGHLRGGRGADERLAVRQRHRDLHPGRRRRPPLPAGDRGRHGRRQRADPGAGGLPLLRRLEGLALRRPPHLRQRRHALLHPRQGRHHPLARPGGRARGRRPRVPAQPLSVRRRPRRSPVRPSGYRTA
ncbi:hypothetical protein SGPA1_30310 [Streptomyces misionensis JCM 4497]